MRPNDPASEFVEALKVYLTDKEIQEQRNAVYPEDGRVNTDCKQIGLSILEDFMKDNLEGLKLKRQQMAIIRRERGSVPEEFSRYEKVLSFYINDLKKNRPKPLAKYS